VISTMLAGGFAPKAADLINIYLNENTRNHARDWLTESIDVRDYKERWWVSRRDFLLEAVVIVLIGWEIHLSYKADIQQAQNFRDQQTVLTNLQESSQASAETLVTLSKTTEIMNKNVERNAQAAESSSATATKSLAVSERAYISCSTIADEPKQGENFRVTVSVLNSGKTPAVELESQTTVGLTPSTEPENEVAKEAFASAHIKNKYLSKVILGPGQSTQQVVESAQPLLETDLSAMKDGSKLFYVFTRIMYDDTLGRHHATETCGRYDPIRKVVTLCSIQNKAN
jgi:hypothetical protein